MVFKEDLSAYNEQEMEVKISNIMTTMVKLMQIFMREGDCRICLLILKFISEFLTFTFVC